MTYINHFLTGFLQVRYSKNLMFKTRLEFDEKNTKANLENMLKFNVFLKEKKMYSLKF